MSLHDKPKNISLTHDKIHTIGDNWWKLNSVKSIVFVIVDFYLISLKTLFSNQFL